MMSSSSCSPELGDHINTTGAALPCKANSRTIDHIRKLQNECNQLVGELEAKKNNHEPLDETLQKIHANSKACFQLYKHYYLEQLDFTVLANFTFFGYNLGEPNSKNEQQNEKFSQENVARETTQEIMNSWADGLGFSDESKEQLMMEMAKCKAKLVQIKEEHRNLNNLLGKALRAAPKTKTIDINVQQLVEFTALMGKLKVTLI
jgi:hypothetical protein